MRNVLRVGTVRGSDVITGVNFESEMRGQLKVFDLYNSQLGDFISPIYKPPVNYISLNYIQ